MLSCDGELIHRWNVGWTQSVDHCLEPSRDHNNVSAAYHLRRQRVYVGMAISCFARMRRTSAIRNYVGRP
jgi:hypothetical protein